MGPELDAKKILETISAQMGKMNNQSQGFSSFMVLNEFQQLLNIRKLLHENFDTLSSGGAPNDIATGLIAIDSNQYHNLLSKIDKRIIKYLEDNL